MADETNTPHDSFFKVLFADLAVAQDFMQNYLPPEISTRLDLATLRLESESFVDPELRKHFSDLLFSVRTTKQEAVYVYLLLEHKSAPEPWVAFQLLRYMVRFWERQHAQGCEKLPLVIPLVFYHGAERWNVPRKFSALYAPQHIGELKKYAVDFEYDLRDLSERGGVEIKGQPKLRAGLALMRYIFSDELEQRLLEIFQHLLAMTRTEALEYARSLLAYLSRARKKVNPQKLRETMQNIFPQIEFDKSALFIQEWMQEGHEKGHEEGLVEGIHKGFHLILVRQLETRLDALDEITKEEIRALPSEKLESLGVALLDFTTAADLQKWLHDNSVIV